MIYILKKEDEYYVGGVLVWSRSPIRAISFLTYAEAEKARKHFYEAEKIIILEGPK